MTKPSGGSAITAGLEPGTIRIFVISAGQADRNDIQASIDDFFVFYLHSPTDVIMTP